MASFRDLHVPGEPLLMANAWDVGSAKLLASLGFRAIATTSSGHAATLGLLDGQVTRAAALDHAAALAAAVTVPVSADLENGFADGPDGVAETVALAVASGAAGCSIEDYARETDSVYDSALAAERVAAAAETAHRGSTDFVLTARAENHIRGVINLDDTIARLRAFTDAGADVVFAPGVNRVDDIRRIVDAVDRPVSVLVGPRSPTVPELAELGVARISVGGGFNAVAIAAVVTAARELLDHGTLAWCATTGEGIKARNQAFA